jgi:hypothetical protein
MMKRLSLVPVDVVALADAVAVSSLSDLLTVSGMDFFPSIPISFCPGKSRTNLGHPQITLQPHIAKHSSYQEGWKG